MNKKIFVFLILLLLVSFSTQAFASLTFTSNAITGTTPSTIDLGTGNTLSLQTTTNAPITIGTGLVTLGGSLNVTGNVVVTGTVSAANIYLDTVKENNFWGYWFSSQATGTGNTSVGMGSFSGLTTGFNNTSSGDNALYSLSSGSNNTAFGANALYNNNTGGYNTAIGSSSLGMNNSASYNTAVGYAALTLNIGNFNTAIGSYALRSVQGTNNVALGYYAGKYETGSNTFYVDNQDRTNTVGDKAGALLYGTFSATPASQTLKINANLNVNSALNKGTCVLGTSCASITVATGAICTATDTTGIFATRAVVSGTTLTITGNSTDTIAYTCL